MADVTKQSWYLPEGSYEENKKAFRDYLVSLGKKYSELTDVQKAAVQDFKEDLEQMDYEKKKLQVAFYQAREAAQLALQQQHDAETIALSQLWQAKEEAGYDVDYVPE